MFAIQLLIVSFTKRLAGDDFDDSEGDVLLSDLRISSTGIKKELSLLCLVAQSVFSREDIAVDHRTVSTLSTLLLGMVRTYTTSRKIRIEEDWVLHVFRIYKSLLPRVTNVALHVPFISRLFGPAPFPQSLFNFASVRNELIQVYETLAAHPSTKGFMTASAVALRDLTAVDPSLLDSRHFDRCIPVFQGLSEDTVSTANPSEPTVYTKKSKEQKAIKKWSWDKLLIGPSYGVAESQHSTSLCTAVVFECLRCLYDSELAIRSAALASLKRLVEEICRWCLGWVGLAQTVDDEHSATRDTISVGWLEVLRGIIVPGMHAGIEHSNDIVKRDFISLLAHMVRFFSVGPGSELASLRPEFALGDVCHAELLSLQHDDPEQDFFENVTHVQMHRRIRALTRLRMQLAARARSENAGEENADVILGGTPAVTVEVRDLSDIQDLDRETANQAGAPSILQAGPLSPISVSPVSLTKVLLPLGFHPLTGSEFTKKDHLSLLQESAAFLGAVAGHLSWPQYLRVLKALLKQLDRNRADKEKILLTAVCAILDAFHFDMSGGLCEAEGLAGADEFLVIKGRIVSSQKSAQLKVSKSVGQSSVDVTSGQEGLGVDADENESSGEDEAPVELATDADAARGSRRHDKLKQSEEKSVDSDDDDIDKKEEEGADLTTADADLDCDHPSHERPMEIQAHVIAKTIVNSVLPWVRVFMLKEEVDHKGNKSKTVRPQIAVALSKLLCRLQAPVVSEERKTSYFVNLIISVIGTLKSRDTSARDSARESLSKMVLTMGIGSLRPVIYEMQHMLVSGYQRHVCNYTVRSLLAAVLQNYDPPVGAPSVPMAELLATSDDANAASITPAKSAAAAKVDIEKSRLDALSDPSILQPDFDKCIPLIMTSVMDDLNGETRGDLTASSDGSARTVIRESKGSKANDTLEICARCILFRPTYALRHTSDPMAVSSVHALASPLLGCLVGCEDAQLIGRVGEGLQRVALGLSRNVSVLAPELLLYLHSTLHPFVAKIVQELHQRKKALGRIVAPSKMRPGSESSSMWDEEDDEALLGADLPSYLREPCSDDEEAALYSKKRTRPGDCVQGKKAMSWLPSERNAMSEQRAVLLERDRQRAERDQVLDGVSAPKLTGTNRHAKRVKSTANGGGGTDPAAIAAVRFCLSLLQSAIKHNRLDSSDPETRSMIVPFVPLLGQCLRLEGAAQVVAQAMRCLCAVLSWGVPVEPMFGRAVATRMLKIMFKGGALLSTDNDLVQACLKGLTALFLLHSQRIGENKAFKGKNIATPSTSAHDMLSPLREENLRSLLQLITISVMEITANFQNVAFQLIRVLVDARVLLPEMYDLMDKLMEQLVLSQRKGIREAASGVLVAYLLGYPLGDRRFTGHLKQLLANCSYAYEEGRLSALTTLATLIRLLPLPVLEESTQMIFLPMALRVVNDGSSLCRIAAAEVVAAVVNRVGPELFSTLLEYSFKWLGTEITSKNSDSSSMISKLRMAMSLVADQEAVELAQQHVQQRALIRTGAQVVSILISTRPDLFKKAGRVAKVVGITRRALLVLMDMPDQVAPQTCDPSPSGVQTEVAALAPGVQIVRKRRSSLEKREMSTGAEGDGDGGKAEHWAVIYHLLMLLEALFAHAPSAADFSCTHPEPASAHESKDTPNSAVKRRKSLEAVLESVNARAVTASSRPVSMMEIVQEAMLFPHAWVRASACRVLQTYLARRDVSLAQCMQQSVSEMGVYVEVLLLPNGLYQIARRLCITLNQPLLPESHLQAAVRCLVFVIRAMSRNVDLSAVPNSAVSHPTSQTEVLTQSLAVGISDIDVEDVDENGDDFIDDDDDDAEDRFHGVGVTQDDNEAEGDESDGVAIDGGETAGTQPSGANWVMQRLRGLGSDSRGRRRLFVIKVRAIIILCNFHVNTRIYRNPQS